MQVMKIRPARKVSHEHLFRRTGCSRFLLDGRSGHALAERLSAPRLQRAISVCCRPVPAYLSHDFDAGLHEPFDALIGFEDTHAVSPVPATRLEGATDPARFGL